MTDEKENRLLAWIHRLIIERNEARRRCVRLARRNEQLEAQQARNEQQQERKSG